MIVLALETSGRVGSVALCDDETMLGEATFEHGLRHAAELLPTIDRLVRSASLTPASIGLIAVDIGPGSFTGLRIAVTLAKTLAFATGAAVVAVPGERVLAQNAPAEAREIITVLDAKRGQCFTARLRRTGDGWETVVPPRVDTLVAMIADAGRPVHLIGDGIPIHRAAVPAEGVHETAPTAWIAQAATVARLGRRAYQHGQRDDLMCLTPLYLRLAEAEERRLSALAIDAVAAISKPA